MDSRIIAEIEANRERTASAAAEAERLLESLRLQMKESEKSAAKANEHVTTLSQVAEDASTRSTQINETNAASKAALEAREREAQESVAEIRKTLDTARDDRKATSSLAERAHSLEETITTSLDSIAEREKQNAALFEKWKETFPELGNKIESLLPGAASAGLASSFKSRKDSFRTTNRIWAAVRVIAMILVALVPLSAYFQAKSVSLNVDGLLYFLAIHGIWRIATAAALAWLAMYAGQRHVRLSRIEEHYAYKEAVATSFEGYKREIEALQDPDLLKKMMSLMIDHMTDAPDRIFDSQHREVTPLQVLMESLHIDSIAEVAKEVGMETSKAFELLSKLVTRAPKQ